MVKKIAILGALVLLAGCGTQANTDTSKPSASPKVVISSNRSTSATPAVTPENRVKPSQKGSTSGKTSADLGVITNGSSQAASLPDFVPAQNVLRTIQTDLSDAGFDCKVKDSKKIDIIPLPGSESANTLSVCQFGDPEGDGFLLFVVTEKSFVKKFNGQEYVKYFNDFQSPIDGLAENNLFTPSSRAILFVLGGKFAFQASEVAWASLDGLMFSPPNRD